MSKDELDNLVFYNCGPGPMVHAAIKVQREFCRDGQTFVPSIIWPSVASDFVVPAPLPMAVDPVWMGHFLKLP